MSALVCGLDVHKDSTYATILDSSGKIVDQTRMNNERVLSYLSRFSVDRVAMESSNQVASLYRKLESEGYSVVLSHPKKTRYIAEAKIKSDRVDSEAIAELLRLDALPLAYMPDKEISVLREQVRRRAFLVRERVRLRVKIKSILTYEGVRWPSDTGLFTRKGVEWLHALNLGPVESYLRVIKTLDVEIRLLSGQLRELARNDEDVKLLMTIPGIGYYSALLVKSEIGDVNRFPFGDRLCSYAGLVPSTHASGNTVRHGGITKEGSRWLRWVMVEAAQTHVHRYDTSITRVYSRIAERRGRRSAVVAAAHKLLLVCYSVLKNRRPYYDQA
ncbi:IS110 family transposase [Candidatus Bathyarchaeota archaeon]|nr:IS110 family transposase [Candidatus Bathyarchaeota archaeon]